MRFGWLAAVAVFISSVPANAATWVQYTLGGTGFASTAELDGTYTTRPVRLTGYLTINIDPVDPGPFSFVDTGSYFYFDGPTVLQAYGTGGSLALDLSCRGRGCQGLGSIDARFDGDPTMPDFIRQSPSNPRGTFYYMAPSLTTFTTLYGEIDTLRVELLNPGDANGAFYYVTATPVPEPAGWVMMIAGVGLLGAVLRRRERPAGDSGASSRPMARI